MSEEQPQSNRPKRILIVEDNRNQAATLMHLLKTSGYEVRAVYDGATALMEMREFLPDVAMLDIGLPGLNGYELARLIRGDPDFAHIMLIAVTAWGREEDRAAALRAGFDVHLTKPVDLNELKTLLTD